MLTLPPEVIALLMPFGPLFTPTVWEHAQKLFLGSVLTTGQRTVAAALRAVGLAHQPHFQNYHRVLNRALWSPRQAARFLLHLLIQRFVPTGPLILGLDDTIERRRGSHIAAKGIYRDPVRSSQGHFVKCSGLRWLSLMLLTPIPFARRVWALPFFTALCPSLRHQQQHRPQRQTTKKLTDWARQLVLQVHRWQPGRTLVVVADSSFAVLELLAAWQRASTALTPLIAVTRLRLDAALYDPAPQRQPGQMGRPRRKGRRQPTLAQRLNDPQTVWTQTEVSHWYGRYERAATSHSQTNTSQRIEWSSGLAVWYHSGLATVPLRWVLVRDPQRGFEPQAFLCTDSTIDPLTILSWYTRRWAVEVTFREVREHLGVETQRQWNAQAIARTTPLLLGLFSLVTLWAARLVEQHSNRQEKHRVSAWYVKERATFSDALAWVRRHVWSQATGVFETSTPGNDKQKLQQQLWQHMTDLLCYAA